MYKGDFFLSSHVLKQENATKMWCYIPNATHKELKHKEKSNYYFLLYFM